MSYLLDTNIVSAMAPAGPDRPVPLVEWFDRHTDELFVSVITVTEILDGIAKLHRRGATRRAVSLSVWWDAIEHLYGPRLLPFDLAAARLAGPLTDRARAQGSSPGFADVAIASIAQAHDLTILTRNIRHFAPLTSRCLDPFQGPLPV